jgi:RNA polymerase sigma factor (sigma-70 family)
MPPEQTIQQTIDHLFRHESGKMVAVLSRLLGLQHMDIAQDIVQDTLLQAMTTWAYGNLPENPSAWLYRVARNRAIDHLRRERKFKEISPRYRYLVESSQELSPAIDQLFLDFEIRDSQLRMIFVCCHPSIAIESQVALSLKTLCGLSVSEIAKAFLTSEETIAKRIYRAREKIRAEQLQLDHPPANELPQRLDAVLQSLYLLFSEGYNSSHPDRLIREELCEEAMRLTYLLTLQQKTNTGETKALLALMCFQTSRLQARLDDKGAIVLLMHQDRSKWYRPLMEKGFAYLEAAMQTPATSSFHLEATIASLHAAASGFEETDWKGICFLYDLLYERKPSPVIAMNRAIAFAYAFDLPSALLQLQQIKGLEHYYLYHTSLGELCYQLGKKEEAITHFKTAISLTPSRQEQALLEKKIRDCGGTE